MCGFVGVIFRDSDKVIQPRRLEAARDTLTHRGPDEAGLWHEPGAGLGHRRLKVLDLTHGSQPMTDSRYALAYNGEIYNFKELQKRYRQAGGEISTQCDTEVLFKLLNRDGLACLDELNGMFAFGHWDTQLRTLKLVRDRLGQKPLYWFGDDQCFVFASELKAVLHWLDRRFELDPVAVDQYFARGYVLSPRTIFQNIQKLPAGCHLTLDAKAWQWNITSYWDVTQTEVPTDPEQAVDQLDELLSDAVAMRLVSDVPIGCLLSGGIDSTLMTAMASKALDEPVLAFSIGFDGDERFNELPYAKMVAEHHGCRWRSKKVELGDFLGLVDDVSVYFDEPFANFAMFPTRRLAQMAREELTVVLSGQGGDELSGGYEGRYNWAAPGSSPGSSPGNAPPQLPGMNPTSMDHLAQHLQRSTLVPWAPMRQAMYSPMMQSQITEASVGSSHVGLFWHRHANFDTLNQVLYTDVKTNLPDYLVCVEERMSMAASLEARNPMLDWRVVNYMMSLPAELKVRNGQYKWILFELAKRYGPLEAIDRPKQGFTPPLGQWIAQGAAALAKRFEEADHLTAPMFSPTWRQYLKAGQYQPAHMMAVFYSLMFAQWVQRYEAYIALPTSSHPKPIANHHWHTATRMLDSVTLNKGRLFAHLFNHFEKSDRVLVVGDTDGWLCRLAADDAKHVVRLASSTDWNSEHVTQLTQTQAVTTVSSVDELEHAGNSDKQAVAGTIIIGLDPVADWLKQRTFVGSRLVCMIPFEQSQQGKLQSLLQQIAQQGKIAGHQVLPLSQTQGALVVRCELNISS